MVGLLVYVIAKRKEKVKVGLMVKYKPGLDVFYVLITTVVAAIPFYLFLSLMVVIFRGAIGGTAGISFGRHLLLFLMPFVPISLLSSTILLFMLSRNKAKHPEFAQEIKKYSAGVGAYIALALISIILYFLFGSY
jgi:hypothetical protein